MFDERQKFLRQWQIGVIHILDLRKGFHKWREQIFYQRKFRFAEFFQIPLNILATPVKVVCRFIVYGLCIVIYVICLVEIEFRPNTHAYAQSACRDGTPQSAQKVTASLSPP